MNRPSIRRDHPSVISISSTEDADAEVIEISSTSIEFNSHPTSPTPPVPNAPHHLVTGHMISWAYSDGANEVPKIHPGSSMHYFEVVEPESSAYQKYLERIGTYVAKTVFGYTGMSNSTAAHFYTC